MKRHDKAPPDKRERAPHHQDPPTDTSTPTPTKKQEAASDLTGGGRQCGADTYVRGLRRRRAASLRMVPLDCGCRDPWPCRCSDTDEISDRMAEAAVAAVALLDQLGTPGLLDERTCKAIWRIGHRRLATAVHRRTTGGPHE